MIEIEAEAFRSLVYKKAAAAYRDLPWRNYRDPYAIMVSEFMLQQTQVARVAPKFIEWIQRFPNPPALAAAAPEDVLRLWNGLGYNRRALALASASRVITEKYHGRVPEEESNLRALPGIGPYTARAIMAFAFDLPTVFLETNIRTVILRHYFPDQTMVEDKRLEAVAALTLDATHPCKWYTALMDYGAELKRVEGNHAKRGASYKPQSPYMTSRRRIRGMVLKHVLESKVLSMDELCSSLPFSAEQLNECVVLLASEGFIQFKGSVISVTSQIL